MFLKAWLLNIVAGHIPHIHASAKRHLIIHLFSHLKIFGLIGKLEAIMLWDGALIYVAELWMPSRILLFLCWVGSIVAYGCSLMDLQHRYIILVDEVRAVLWLINFLRIVKLDYFVGPKSWPPHNIQISSWRSKDVLVFVLSFWHKSTKIQLVLKICW